MTTDVPITENRIAVSLPIGDDLIDGEQLVFTSTTGDTTITFIDSAVNAGPFTVNFQDGDSPTVLGERLVRALPVEFSAFLDAFGTGDVLVNAVGVSQIDEGTSIVTGPFAGIEIIVPNSAGLMDGERLDIVGPGNPSLTFIDSAVPGPANTVHFDSAGVGEPATVIAQRLFDALPGNVDKSINGSRIIFYGASNATTDNPTPGLQISANDSRSVTLPTGLDLNDGETLTITASGIPTTFTFNNSTATAGPGEVNYQPGESAAEIAAKLLAAMPASYNAVLQFNNPETIRFTATDSVVGTLTSMISFSPTVYTNDDGDTTNDAMNLLIGDGVDLVDGERIQIFSGRQFAEIQFIQIGGGTTVSPGATPIFYTNTDVASDLYPQILQALPVEMQAYVDLLGNGINFVAPPFFGDIDPIAFFIAGSSAFTIGNEAVNEAAVPLTLPAGSEINEFETIRILQKDDVFGQNQLTFAFVTAANAGTVSNAIVYDPNGSAADVALATLQALPRSLQAYLGSDQQINMLNALSVIPAGTSSIVGFATDRFNAIPVTIDSSMDEDAVASRLRVSLAEGFGRLVTASGQSDANPDNYKIYGGNRIRVYFAQPVENGPYGTNYADPNAQFGLENISMPGDEFGPGRSTSISNTSATGSRQVVNDNVVQGIYLDDIVIGFAERGEMVIGAPSNTGFTFNPETLPDTHPQAVQPELQNESLLGKYSLEIRTSDEYGVPEDYDPINLVLDEEESAGRSFDTNDRLANEATTIIVQPGNTIDDGDTFVLSDGIRRVTFEFDSTADTSSQSFIPGNVPIVYDASSDNSRFIAQSIRDAINSDQAQGLLRITAATGDSRERGDSNSDKVELFGENISVNSADGRFIKVDLVEEETFQGRETAKTIPIVDHDAATVTEANFPNSPARALVTHYADGNNDVLVGIGKIGDYVTSDELDGDDPIIVRNQPQFDVDWVRVYLEANQTVDIDVDSIGFVRGLAELDLPVVIVRDASTQANSYNGGFQARSSLNTPSTAPGEFNSGAFLQFTAPADGYYDVGVSSANAYGNSTLRVSDFSTFSDATNLDTDTFRLDIDGAQTTFEFTIDANRLTPNELIVVEAADTANTLAIKIATAIKAAIPAMIPVPIDRAVEDGFVNLFDVAEVVEFTSSDLFNNLSFTQRTADYGEYSLTIRPQHDPTGTQRDVLMVDYQFGRGDLNRVKDQGQIIIDSNFISNSSNYGIVATSGARGQALATTGNGAFGPDDLSRPGSSRLLSTENDANLIPGAVIANNVVYDSGAGGIFFAGEQHVSGTYPAPISFGRIYNNTLVGDGVGAGVTVNSAASPTLLNNVVSGFETGFDVDASSIVAGTTTGANVFKDNGTDSTLPLASSSLVVGSNTELFQDPANKLFIPAPGAPSIDNSVGSLPDRQDFFKTVKEPAGIGPSPIIAPFFDAYGQQRVDDTSVQTPGGIGLNPNIDRGAIDRADDTRPIARLTEPQDAIGTMDPLGDQDSQESFVRLTQGIVEFLEVQLLDNAGSGPDVRTLTSNSVLLTENGNRLIEGIDYVYGYSDNSRTIRLTPLAGLFRSDAVYEITLNNKQRFQLDFTDGSQIGDGDQVATTDTNGAQSVFEYESGYVISVPRSRTILVTGTNADFQDRQTFTISSPDGTSRTFEINTIASFSGNNVEVNLMNAGTIMQVRDAVLAAINSPDPVLGDAGTTVAEALGLSPQPIGSSGIQLGFVTGHDVTGTVAGLEFLGEVSTVAADETFTYAVGDQSVTFTFTSAPANPADPSQISISPTDTPEEIAVKIRDAVRSFPELGLDEAQAVEDKVLLGGSEGDLLGLVNSSLVLEGSPGVTGGLTLTIPDTGAGIALDTTAFSVNVDGTEITFRYTADPTLTSPDRLIQLVDTLTIDDIAQRTAEAIELAFNTELAPTFSGPVVTLGEQQAIPEDPNEPRSIASVDPSDTGIEIQGVSGGAIPVSFIPSDQFSSAAASATLEAAIRSAPLNVETFSPGGGTLFLENAARVQGSNNGGNLRSIGSIVRAVADLAGNPVQETRVNDETRFTIIMPEVKFDLGDAPDDGDETTTGDYQTLFSSDGPRHTVGGDRLPRLGQLLDTEPDGQPNATATGDDIPLPIAFAQVGGLFSVSTSGPTTTISVAATIPTGDKRLSVTVGGLTKTFELIASTENTSDPNFIAVNFTGDDTAESIASKIALALRAEIDQIDDSLRMSYTPGTSEINITAIDDEDGLMLGTFVPPGGGFGPLTVFYRAPLPGETIDTTNLTPDQVLGFINPKDGGGSVMNVEVTGSGLLDGWIDLNGDGLFSGDGEQVITNVPVVNGLNTVSFVAPETSTDVEAVARQSVLRLRISNSGNLGPVGVSVGGEVEDYIVTILPVSVPTADPISYTTGEDIPLVVDATTGETPLFNPAVKNQNQILDVRYFVVDQPSNGTVEVDVNADGDLSESLEGHFRYTPNPDFYGTDTFTYRLSTQQSNSSAVGSNDVATVTITVTPINDNPLAVDQTFTAIEDTERVITAAELLAGTGGDAVPSIDFLPFNEANQLTYITAIEGITASSNPKTATTSEGGTVTAEFNASGRLTLVRYVSGQDFNSDNLPIPGADPADPTTPRFDQFTFTVTDDGQLQDVNGNDLGGVRLPASSVATASMLVRPVNDAPAPVGDNVSISNPNFQALVDIGATTVPTEDEALTIPASFLLANDGQGPLTAQDEVQQINGNDGALTLIEPVGLVDPTLGSIELGIGGDLLFTPADDVYGTVFFTYTVQDSGFTQDINGTAVEDIKSTTVTSSIFLEPVNDAPSAFDRALTTAEDTELVFTSIDLINGNGTESANIGNLGSTAIPPYDESDQTLRVVAFATSLGGVSVLDLTGNGQEQLSLETANRGELRFNFVNGIFLNGSYLPAENYNEREPFQPFDLFTYTVADDGFTTLPVLNGNRDLADVESLTQGTVSIQVTEVNDDPVFQSIVDVNVRERDDSQGTTVPNFVFGAAPGPSTATDELAVQTLNYTIDAINVPTGLMLQKPEVTDNGSLIVYPAPDQFGLAVYVVTATDDEPSNPLFSTARSTSKTFTINVRPVNDAPRFDPTKLGLSDAVVPVGGTAEQSDDAFVVSNDPTNPGVITYTLREDNTQQGGDTSQPFFIPITQGPSSAGYARLGLLDVFVPGPLNEINDLPGGSQQIELLDFPARTVLGGFLESGTVDGRAGLLYRPPLNFNNEIGGTDLFTYSVIDKSQTGGESYSLSAASLVADRLTSTNQVRLNLNPVNDRPEFELSTDQIEIPEDGSAVSFDNFAFNINAGPPFNAFDEVDINDGQDVNFSVTLLGFPNEDPGTFFSQFPAIDPNGRLTFETAPDVFGSFDLEITLTDNGEGNDTRGDLISSLTQTLSLIVQPINDPPRVDPQAGLIEYTLLEDGTVEIPISGDATNPGLLDVFRVGPANEESTVTPGGNQSLSLNSPVPVASTEGGTITPVNDAAGNLVAFRYRPRANFVGRDTIIYTVTDDGVSVDFGTGNGPRNDPRIASNTVGITVQPVNDAPIFSGGTNVINEEDENVGFGAGVIRVQNWATNVTAGPAGAIDEINGEGGFEPQELTYNLTRIDDGGDDLFVEAPQVLIQDAAATLFYILRPNANGTATFRAQLTDNGGTNAAIGDDAAGDPITFTITVNAINDVPTFTAGGDVTVGEDSGPYSQPWATNISPGPADESEQTVVFDVTVSPEDQTLFASLPEISEAGILRFTPAENAVGVADVIVTAIDIENAFSLPQNLQITIGELNDRPRPVADVLDPSDEDTVLIIQGSTLLANDIDPDVNTNPGETLSIQLPTQSLSVSGAAITFDPVSQTIRYNPQVSNTLQALAPGESTTDSFSYRVVDAAGSESGLVVVSLDINGINDAPRLVEDQPTLNPDGTTIIRPLDNDTDIDGQIDRGSVQLDQLPAFGSIDIDQNGIMTYTPFAPFIGEDIFTYTVADDLGLRSAPQTISVSANPAPEARPDGAGGFVDEAFVIDVAANDSDVGNESQPNRGLDLGSIQIATEPERGEVVPLGDGTVRFLADPGFVGRDSFTYTIADAEGRRSNETRVDVQVVASRLQNPRIFQDVNASGEVTALDALLIVNFLDRLGENQSSAPVNPSDLGPPYYDANGDGIISSSDALFVVNQLQFVAPSQRSGSGEQIMSVAPDFGSVQTVAGIADDESAFALAPRPEFPKTNKVVSSEIEIPLSDTLEVVEDDVVDLLAGEQDSQEGKPDELSMVDAALADF